MKKILGVLLLLVVIGISAPKAHAISLDDLFAEITSLKNQVSELRTQLSAAVISATVKTQTPAVGKVQEYNTYAEALDACKKTWPNSSWLHAFENADGYFCDHGGFVTPEPVITSTQTKTETPVVSKNTSIQTITSSTSQVTTNSQISNSVKTATYPTPTVSAPQITLSLARGSDNIQVTTLQQVLASLGFFSGDYTTYFGAKTEVALKAFQAANGLEAVGSVGPKTRAILNEKAGGSSLGGTGTTPTSLTCNSNTQPWIKILAPNGGEVFTANSSDIIRIKWRSCNIKNVRLELRQNNMPPEYSGGYSFYVITSSSPNTGSFDFPLSNFSQLSPVAGTITPGNNFYIRASDSYDFDVFFDYSDQPFTINSQSTLPSLCNSSSTPSIRVISPNGGETYTAGQQITVKWSSCNIPANENVRIDLNVAPFPPLGVNGVSLANTPNDGVQVVTLPVASAFNGNPMSFGTNFKINIWKSGTGTPSDLSDNLFTINAQQPCTFTQQVSPTSPLSQNVAVGTNNFRFTDVRISSTCAVNINTLKVNVAGTISPNQIGSSLNNVSIYDSSNLIGTAPIIGTTAIFTGLNISIPVNTAKTFQLKSNVIGGAGLTARLGLYATLYTESVSGIGGYNATQVWGNMMNITQ